MEEIFYRDEALDDENQVASSNLQLSTPTVEASTSAATISNSSTSVASIVDDKSHLDSPTSNSCFPCLRGREKQSTMVSSPQIVETNIPEVEAGEAEIDHAPRLEHVNVNNYMCRVGEDLNATVKKYMKYN
ncbi:hypothetical protein M5689_012265 [Euphorbia peplus]|nr:hypothetical protein M5689_012265 [Euphorbia peplus]